MIYCRHINCKEKYKYFLTRKNDHFVYDPSPYIIHEYLAHMKNITSSGNFYILEVSFLTDSMTQLFY